MAKSRESDAETGARRFVHLAVDESDLGLAEVVLHDDAGVAHFVVKIVAFTGTLTHPGEHGVTTVGLGDVVDELQDDNGLADARTTERASLAALDEGADEIDNLDAGFRGWKPWCPARRAEERGGEWGISW